MSAAPEPHVQVDEPSAPDEPWRYVELDDDVIEKLRRLLFEHAESVTH
jgi:hypothetical protein